MNLMNLIQAMRSGANARAFVSQMARQNPVYRQAERIANGKDSQQLMQTVSEMCRQRGTTPEALAQQLGLYP